MENLKLRTVGWLKGIQEKPDDDNQKENCVEQKRFLPADCVAVPGRRCLRPAPQLCSVWCAVWCQARAQNDTNTPSLIIVVKADNEKYQSGAAGGCACGASQFKILFWVWLGRLAAGSSSPPL